MLILFAIKNAVPNITKQKAAGVAYFNIFLGNSAMSYNAELTIFKILMFFVLFFSLLLMDYPSPLINTTLVIILSSVCMNINVNN
jgi:hypothetical protein